LGGGGGGRGRGGRGRGGRGVGRPSGRRREPLVEPGAHLGVGAPHLAGALDEAVEGLGGPALLDLVDEPAREEALGVRLHLDDESRLGARERREAVEGALDLGADAAALGGLGVGGGGDLGAKLAARAVDLGDGVEDVVAVGDEGGEAEANPVDLGELGLLEGDVLGVPVHPVPPLGGVGEGGGEDVEGDVGGELAAEGEEGGVLFGLSLGLDAVDVAERLPGGGVGEGGEEEQQGGEGGGEGGGAHGDSRARGDCAGFVGC